VYGDTDSVFIHSKIATYSDALAISSKLKSLVNKQYSFLEIDLDGIYERLLLLQKKKYAALKVDENLHSSIVVKGLDMKRREYSTVSKDVSQ
jgi:DNA polymerase alpha subunit A